MRSENTDPSSNTIKVLLVDDDPEVISSLSAYFSTDPTIRVIGSAGTGIEALSLLENLPVDVIVADIHMPEMNGVALLHKTRKHPHPPAFVAITALDTDRTMLDVLTGGGAGYILKSSRPQDIIAAVHDAMDGGTAVSPQALRRLVGYLSDDPSSTHPSGGDFALVYVTLTEMEKDVLGHLCEGKSNAEIATSLNYAESTIKKQVSKLISSFGVTSRLSLVVAALHSGLIDYR